MVDPELRFETKVEEGSSVQKGTILAEVEGNTRSILLGERLSLNLMQTIVRDCHEDHEFVDALEGLPPGL